jgi:hypothetical protein
VADRLDWRRDFLSCEHVLEPDPVVAAARNLHIGETHSRRQLVSRVCCAGCADRMRFLTDRDLDITVEDELRVGRIR